MDLFLIRHMPTPDNAAGLLQGRRDVSILPPGPEDQVRIQQNRQALSPLSRFDHILVSGLKRTRQTAALYTESVTPEPLMDELDFGPYEGRSRQDLLRDHPEWETDPSDLVLGESLADLSARIEAFLDKYNAFNRVLAFGHGAWIRALSARLKTGGIASMNRIIIPHNTIIRMKGDAIERPNL